MFFSIQNHPISNIDIGKYRLLSAVTAILISDIGIGQNFHIGASLIENKGLFAYDVFGITPQVV
jgi:hypothetical protein